jgi:hypothetical protein
MKNKLTFEIEHLSAQAGVYRLISNGLCLYVGKAIDLKQRLQTHIERRDDFDEIQVDIFTKTLSPFSMSDSNKILSLLENFAILREDPIENINRPMPCIFKTMERLDSMEAKRFVMSLIYDVRK